MDFRPSLSRLLCSFTVCLLLAGCAGGVALQPDRSIFALDNSYQRMTYDRPIEDMFDRTVAVFQEAGYRLDLIDRATGQISGQRGAAGNKQANTDKDLKFYAVVLPEGEGTVLALKIVQVIKGGAFGGPTAEIIVNEALLYKYAFRRIGTMPDRPVAKEPQVP
jgi:hypothetical protein